MDPVGVNTLFSFFFRPDGRISRLEYALGVGLILVVNLAGLSFLMSLEQLASLFLVIAIVFGIPFVVAQFVLVAKRCHDIGLPGTFTLLLFIPVLGVAWLFFLVFMPGTRGPNAYGEAPRFESGIAGRA